MTFDNLLGSYGRAEFAGGASKISVYNFMVTNLRKSWALPQYHWNSVNANKLLSRERSDPDLSDDLMINSQLISLKLKEGENEYGHEYKSLLQR